MDDRALFYLEAEAAHNARIKHLDNMVDTMSRKKNDSTAELLQKLATLRDENQRLEYELKMAVDIGQTRHNALSSQLDLAKKQLHDITKRRSEMEEMLAGLAQTLDSGAHATMLGH